jgi:hypothetical protein
MWIDFRFLPLNGLNLHDLFVFFLADLIDLFDDLVGQLLDSSSLSFRSSSEIN